MSGAANDKEVGFGLWYCAIHKAGPGRADEIFSLLPRTYEPDLLIPIGYRKLSYWFIFLIRGPSINDAELPPDGTTLLIVELVIVSVLPAPVFINPLVSNKLPLTSIAPPSLTVSPALLFTSKWLNALEPVKLPKEPPMS